MASLRLLIITFLLSLLSSTSALPSIPFPRASNDSASEICGSGNSKCIPFTIEVTWEQVNPTNGVARHAILMNGTFPGPPLTLKVGECVDFTVINNLPYATAVHFHGISQKNTPWADGVPGLTQYPIDVGESYMYQWTAHEPGMYFYHGHYKGQMVDGLYGAIFVQAADDAETPFQMIEGGMAVDALKRAEAKVEPLFVSDWSRYTFAEFYQIEEDANIDDACVDSIILNGLGSVYCLTPDQIRANQSPRLASVLVGGSLTAKGCVPPNNTATQGNYTRNLAAIPAAAYDECTASSGKTYKLEVDPADDWAAISMINPGNVALLLATIDNHKLYVYEWNGHYINPQTVDQVSIANGERISFFVKLDQTPGDYTIRIANSGINQVISGFGILSYKSSLGASTIARPLMNFGGQSSSSIVTFSGANAAPHPSVAVSSTADSTHKLDIMKAPNQPDSYIWTLSGISSYDHTRDDQDPLLFQNPNAIPDSDLIIKSNHNKWIDLVVEVAGPLAEPHPLHKHANKFFVIGSGAGPFVWDSVASASAAGVPFNLNNPPYVDTYTTTGVQGNSSWLVLRYRTEEPGAWFFHCHIQTHFTGGMAIALLDGVDDFPTLPSDVGKVCPGNGKTKSTWSSPQTGTGSYTLNPSDGNPNTYASNSKAEVVAAKQVNGNAAGLVTPSSLCALLSFIGIIAVVLNL